MTSFAYPSEKFSEARRKLMLPHPRGEAFSISDAFHSCSLGLASVDKGFLDDEAIIQLAKALLLTLQSNGPPSAYAAVAARLNLCGW